MATARRRRTWIFRRRRVPARLVFSACFPSWATDGKTRPACRTDVGHVLRRRGGLSSRSRTRLPRGIDLEGRCWRARGCSLGSTLRGGGLNFCVGQLRRHLRRRPSAEQDQSPRSSGAVRRPKDHLRRLPHASGGQSDSPSTMTSARDLPIANRRPCPPSPRFSHPDLPSGAASATGQRSSNRSWNRITAASSSTDKPGRRQPTAAGLPVRPGCRLAHLGSPDRTYLLGPVSGSPAENVRPALSFGPQPVLDFIEAWSGQHVKSGLGPTYVLATRPSPNQPDRYRGSASPAPGAQHPAEHRLCTPR